MIKICITVTELENGVVTAESAPEWDEPTAREAHFASQMTVSLFETLEERMKQGTGGQMIWTEPGAGAAAVEALLQRARNLPPE